VDSGAVGPFLIEDRAGRFFFGARGEGPVWVDPGAKGSR
jgi:hypothetical protein